MCCMVDFERQMERRELCSKINEMVKELPVKCRIILIARLKHNTTYRELADEFGVSQDTIRQLYIKAIREFKRPRITKILIQYYDYAIYCNNHSEIN